MTKKPLLLAASSLALLWGAPLIGQGVAHAAAADADRQASSLEEVVVVARRTEENLQTVPLSVTAISGAELQTHTITTGTDLQKLVPNLNVGVSIFGAAQQYSLRGVRTGVVTYFNEVPIATSTIDLQLFDLSSIQAVAGPQGTLFGRNSTGGAILFVPQRPTDRFEGYVDARVGNYNLREGTLVVNLPVNDKLKLRFDARRTLRDGPIKNLSGPALGAQERTILRGSLLFEPTDWLTEYAVMSYARRDDTPNGQISGNGGTLPPCPVTLPSCIYGARYVQELQAQQARGVRSVSIPVNVLQYDEPWLFTNVLSAKLGDMTLKYIAGYGGGQSRQLQSVLSIPLPVIIGQNAVDRSRQYTNELQVLGSSFNDRLTWQAGLYSSHSKSSGLNKFLLFAPIGTVFSDATTQQSGGDNEDRSKAAYAQGTFALTDKLNVTAGARYTKDHPSTSQVSFVVGHICALPNFRNVDRVACRQNVESRSHATTYNLSVDYQATDDVLLYATTRKGYNAGGFNTGIDDPTLEIVRPEFITDYEAGFKADWTMGGVPIRANASTFLAKYKDIQRTTSLIYNGIIVTANFNAARATIYGAQLALLARPLPDLDLALDYGYLHTKYDSFPNSILGDQTGNKFAQAPKNTLNLSATYRHPMPTGQLVANANYAYISAVTFADDNLRTPGNTGKSYGLVDLRVDWKNIADRNVDLGVYVKNAFDKEYILNATDRTTPFGFISRLYGDPRTYGVELRYTFGGN
ncbi:MAG: hypothetical protein JWQ29_2773 [Phenylobacterium sp.]|nr:hypothetical protein [Phenylobacterium sp.]